MASMFVAVVLCIGFVSCSDDDDEDTKDVSIIGNWKMTKCEFWDENEQGVMTHFTGKDAEDELGEMFDLEMNEDNRGYVVAGTDKVSFGYSYSALNKKVTFSTLGDFFEDSETEFLIKTLNTTTLVIRYYVVNDSEEGWQFTFSRK